LRRLAALATLAAMAPATAFAGAWTQPAGQGQATVSLYGWAGEAAPSGYYASPKENEVQSQLYVEYGLADRLMLVGSVALERYAILSPANNTYTGPDYSQIGLQYQVAKWDDWVFSVSSSLFIPGATESSQPAQAGNTGGAAEVRGLAGRSFALSVGYGFVDAEIAYRDRTAGPPSEWHGDLTLGYKPNDTWTFMVQSFNEVTDGAGDPGFPGITESIEQVSVLYAINKQWSLQVGAFATAVSIGTNSERGGVVSITRKF
jgi:protein XagA